MDTLMQLGINLIVVCTFIGIGIAILKAFVR
jgi:hypothetical protein